MVMMMVDCVVKMLVINGDGGVTALIVMAQYRE